MATLYDALHLTLHARDVFRMQRLGIQGAQHIRTGVILHQRERNNYGISLNVGQSESSNALAKDADYGEGELAHANRAADWIFQPEYAIGKLFGDQANFAACFHI